MQISRKLRFLKIVLLIVLILFSSLPLSANSIVTLPAKNLLEIDVARMLDFNLFNRVITADNVLTDIVYKEVDDQEIKLDIYLPAESAPHPVIIFFHGGFFLRGDKKEVRELTPLLQAFLNKGWLVISADYRLFNRKNVFPDNIQDVKDTIRWVRKNAGEIEADPDHIGLMGYSAGGNLALLAGLTEDAIFRGSSELSQYSSGVDFIVSCSGPTKLHDVQDPNLDLEKTFISYFYKDELDVDLLKKASPVTYLKKDAPPVLLIHGTEDVIVPFTQASTFYQRAGEIGTDCTLIKINGGGHTIRLTYLARINELREEILYFIENRW